MMAADRDALVCDLAETYGIFDMRALPASLLATLAAGLRENSRIKTILYGEPVTRSDAMLAAAVDRLSMLVWFLSEDGKKGANRPKSVLDALLGEPGRQQEGNVQTFESAEDFEAEWERRTGVGHGK